VFITFFGQARAQVSGALGTCIMLPLVVLAVLSIVGGFVELPDTLGRYTLFSEFLSSALPAASGAPDVSGSELVLQVIAAVASLAGIYLAYLLYVRVPGYVDALARTEAGAAVQRFWYSGWGFDWLYDKSIVQPYLWIARADKDDFVDLIYDGIAAIVRALYRMMVRTQTGQLRWYATGIALGAVVTLAIVVLL